MREDTSRWLQHNRAEGGPADGERDGAAEEEEEERTVCSWSTSPLLESSMETAGEENVLCHHTLMSSALVHQHVCVNSTTNTSTQTFTLCGTCKDFKKLNNLLNLQ